MSNNNTLQPNTQQQNNNNTDTNEQLQPYNATQQTIEANNAAKQLNALISQSFKDSTTNMFLYTLNGNPYSHTIQSSFQLDNDFITQIQAPEISNALTKSKIEKIIQQKLPDKKYQQYFLKKYKSLEDIKKDKTMTYEQFILFSFLLANSDEIQARQASSLIKNLSQTIDSKQQAIQSVGSKVGYASMGVGLVASALTIGRIFWGTMPQALFVASLVITITFALYTLITRLINLYRTTQLHKNSDDVEKLNNIAQNMQNNLVQKFTNLQQNINTQQQEKIVAQKKTEIENIKNEKEQQIKELNTKVNGLQQQISTLNNENQQLQYEKRLNARRSSVLQNNQYQNGSINPNFALPEYNNNNNKDSLINFNKITVPNNTNNSPLLKANPQTNKKVNLNTQVQDNNSNEENNSTKQNIDLFSNVINKQASNTQKQPTPIDFEDDQYNNEYIDKDQVEDNVLTNYNELLQLGSKQAKQANLNHQVQNNASNALQTQTPKKINSLSNYNNNNLQINNNTTNLLNTSAINKGQDNAIK